VNVRCRLTSCIAVAVAAAAAAPTAFAARPAPLDASLVGASAVARGGVTELPVLLTRATQRRARRSSPVLVLRLPRGVSLRRGSSTLARGALRLGDRMRFTRGAALPRHGRSALVTGVRVGARGPAPTFDELRGAVADAQVAASDAAAGVAQVQAIPPGGGVSGPSPSVDQVRATLTDLRTRLGLLDDRLQGLIGQLGTAIGAIDTVFAREGARSAQARRAESALADPLRSGRDGLAAASAALESSVTRIDEVLSIELPANHTDPSQIFSQINLPFGTTSTAAAALAAVRQLLPGIPLG
jgi:hypothetical protein